MVHKNKNRVNTIKRMNIDSNDNYNKTIKK